MRRGRRMLARLAVAALAVIGPIQSAAEASATRSSKTDRLDESQETVRWYRCTLGGAPCGRMVETTAAVPGGGEMTRTELLLRFERSGVVTSVVVRTEIEIDAEGGPVRMMLEQAFGDEPVVTDWAFGPDGVVEKRRQGRRLVESRLPRPSGAWHLPGAAFEIARRTATAEEPVTLQVVDPSRGIEPVSVTYRRTGRESIVVNGVVLDGERWEVEETDGTVTTEIVDEEGATLVSRAAMGAGLGELEVAIADRVSAEAAAAGRVELLESGMVKPTFAVPARRLDRGDRARYRLLLPTEAQIADDIGGQSIESVEDIEGGKAVVIVVEVGLGSPPQEEAEGDDADRHLVATAAIDADDPDVVRFAKGNDRRGAPDFRRAATLRSAVHRHISRKGLATAFATAGETVRSRTGDCTEHAVLLAAALRAVGIPSRTVSGLVWTTGTAGAGTGAFLWHMWTQALIDGRWMDFDATLPGGRVFHPGHVAVTVSDGSRRGIEASGRAMLDAFGSIRIEVLPLITPGESTDSGTP